MKTSTHHIRSVGREPAQVIYRSARTMIVLLLLGRRRVPVPWGDDRDVVNTMGGEERRSGIFAHKGTKEMSGSKTDLLRQASVILVRPVSPLYVVGGEISTMSPGVAWSAAMKASTSAARSAACTKLSLGMRRDESARLAPTA